MPIIFWRVPYVFSWASLNTSVRFVELWMPMRVLSESVSIKWLFRNMFVIHTETITLYTYNNTFQIPIIFLIVLSLSTIYFVY